VAGVAALLAALIAVGGAAAWLLLRPGEPGAREAAEPFVAAWSRGDDRGAARLTDDPRLAAEDLAANRRGLDGATVRARLLDVTEREDSARARVEVAWQVPGIGRWSYRSAMSLRRADDRWAIAWSPKIVHPSLDEIRRLGTTRDPARRGNVLDRNGVAIVRPRTVYRVGLARDEVRDVGASVASLAAVVDVDVRPFTRAVRGAGPKQFVEAITLREPDYRRVEDQLDGVPGALAVRAEAPLAETRSFARALLGTVGPATAEQLERLAGERGPGDEVGQSGLQARYERRLGGTAGRSIVIRVEGVPAETLLERRGRAGRPLRTTLDAGVQRAAESALGGRAGEAALVAVQPSTGDVLAVANRPVDSAYDRALEGRYPPGSTFKVVTTAALLRDGLSPDEVVDCPQTIAVGGRSFKNFEGNAQGPVPFAQDFAQSCNTAFVSLTERLPADALGQAARDFGLGESLRLGMPAAEAEVPPGRDLVARAAAMIGQDRILASPLAMAGVPATVAAGRWHAPRLLAGDPRRAGARLDATERDTLRELMRSVVTEGTGTALASVPGSVGGKSGTAEYGGGDPPPTHAWFIAYRDDVAIAVLVENGRSGGAVAAPIAARFFAACDAEGACG
jgi:cell division protein FtsI/penicillin-binding protein 2